MCYNAKLIKQSKELLENLIRLTANAGLQSFVSENKGTLLETSFNKAIDAIEKATE